VDTVLLYGERFDAYDVSEGWVWGQSRRDGYVGYVPQAALSTEISDVAALWMTSLVAPSALNDEFAVLGELFLPIQHLVPIEHVASDWVAVAETFLHAPYVWGGKTAAGIDCSGLMQVAMARAGISAPRDSDMLRDFGEEASANDLQRGDMLFWKGHVGVMTDADTLLHATAFSMRVMREPVKNTRKRIETDLGLPLLTVRRVKT